MGLEETDDGTAFKAAGPWLQHVHLASRTRILPGQDDRSFLSGFRGLKAIDYRHYCSLECGIPEGTEREVAIPAAFEFLRGQWDEA
jgi:sugar phosphate isomerase/epimerase